VYPASGKNNYAAERITSGSSLEDKPQTNSIAPDDEMILVFHPI
jgi:hypothetical protein